jgi:hypothetical protein
LIIKEARFLTKSTHHPKSTRDVNKTTTIGILIQKIINLTVKSISNSRISVVDIEVFQITSVAIINNITDIIDIKDKNLIK